MSEGKNRLNSWKEIAVYLRCDESTARRRERDNKLPVYRAGGRGHAVYAFEEELDDWLRGRPEDPLREYGRQPSKDSPASPDESGPGVPAESETYDTAAPSLFRRERYWKAVAIGGALVAVLLWTSVDGLGRRKSRPLRPELSAAPPEVPSVVHAGSSPAESPDSNPVREDEIFQLKNAVKRSQIWETLTLYSTPWICDAHDLERYWEPGSPAFLAVGESVSRLNERGLHYGFGAKLTNFEFRYLRISRDGLSAEVGTIEHWWLPVYTQDQKAVPNRNSDQGPYEIDYLLVKTSGRWRLKSTTTPYSQWKPRKITCKNWPAQTTRMASVNSEAEPKKRAE